MPLLTARYIGSQLRAESYCNGCGQFVKIDANELPALFRSSMARAMLKTSITIKLPGLYFGPCCSDAAGMAWDKRNAAITRKELNRGKRK